MKDVDVPLLRTVGGMGFGDVDKIKGLAKGPIQRILFFLATFCGQKAKNEPEPK
jgi:hypothetical protein